MYHTERDVGHLCLLGGTVQQCLVWKSLAGHIIQQVNAASHFDRAKNQHSQVQLSSARDIEAYASSCAFPTSCTTRDMYAWRLSLSISPSCFKTAHRASTDVLAHAGNALVAASTAASRCCAVAIGTDAMGSRVAGFKMTRVSSEEALSPLMMLTLDSHKLVAGHIRSRAGGTLTIR